MPTDFVSPLSPVTTETDPRTVSASPAEALIREFLLVPGLRKEGVCNLLIPSGTSQVGSDERCQIRLTNPGIADVHARFECSNGKLTIQAIDHRSWLNDGPVRSNSLRAGDRLTLGPVEFRVHERFKEPVISRPTESVAISAPAQPVSRVVELPELPVTPMLKSTEQVREVVQRDLRIIEGQMAALSPPTPLMPDLQNGPAQTFDLSGPLKREIARLVDELDEQKRDALTVRNQLRQSEIQVEHLQNRKGGLEEQVSQLSEQKAQSDSELAGFRKELHQTIERLTAQTREASLEAEQLRNELSAKEQSLLEVKELFDEQKIQWEQSTTGLESELAVLTSTLSQVEHELTANRRASQIELEEKATQISQLTVEVGTLRVELEDAQKGQVELKQQSDAIPGFEAELLRLTDLLSAANEELDKSKVNFDSQLSVLQAEVDANRLQYSTLSSENSSLQKQLEEQKSDLDLREATLATASTELKSRLCELDEKQSSLELERQKIEEDRVLVQSSREELKNRESELTAKEAAWDAEKTQSQETLQLRAQQLEEAVRQADAKGAELATRSEELDRIAAELDEKQSENLQIRSELDEQKSRVAADLQALEQGNEQLLRDQEDLSAQKTLLEERIAEFERSAQTREEEIANKEGELSKAASELDRQSSELSAQKADLDLLREELNAEKTAVADQKVAFEAEKAAYQNQLTEYDSDRDRLKTLESRLDDEQRLLEASRQELEQLSASHAAQLEQIEQLTRQIVDRDVKISTYEEKSRFEQGLNDELLAESRSEIEQLKRQLEERQSLLNETQAELSAAKTQHELLSQDLNTHRSHLLSLESQVADDRVSLEKQIVEYREQLAALEKQRQAQEEQCFLLKTRETGLQEELDSARSLNQEVREESDRLRQQADEEYRETINALEVSIHDAQVLIESLNNELALYKERAVNDHQTLQSQLDDTVRQLSESITTCAQLREQLNALQSEASHQAPFGQSSLLDTNAIQQELHEIGIQKTDLDNQAEILDRRNAELNSREEKLANLEREWLFEEKQRRAHVEEREVAIETIEQTLAHQQHLLEELKNELDAQSSELKERQELLEVAFQRLQSGDHKDSDDSASFSDDRKQEGLSTALGDHIWQNLQSTFQEDTPVFADSAVESDVDLSEIMKTPLNVSKVPATSQPDPEASPAPDIKVRSMLAEMFGMSTTTNSQIKQVASDANETVDQESHVLPEENPFADLLQPFTEAGESDIESTTPDQEESESGEESIASYMEKLLNRTRGHQKPQSSGHMPSPASSAKPVHSAASYKPSPAAAERKHEPTPEADETPIDVRAVVRERPQLDKDAARQDIHKLRTLANQSARVAVATHTWRQVRGGIVINAVLAGTSFLLAIALCSSAIWAEQSYFLYGGLAGLVGVVSTVQLYRLTEITKRVKTVVDEDKTTKPTDE